MLWQLTHVKIKAILPKGDKVKYAEQHAMPLSRTQPRYKPRWAQATQKTRGLLEWVVAWMVINQYETH